MEYCTGIYIHQKLTNVPILLCLNFCVSSIDIYWACRVVVMNCYEYEPERMASAALMALESLL